MFRRIAQFGNSSVPAGGFNETQRYATGPAGTPVPVEAPGVPALADGIFRLGDALEASKTGKPGGPQTLSADPLYDAQNIAAITPIGRITPTGLPTGKTRIKLAAKGYVNPADIALKRGLRGQPTVSDDLETKA